jgi:hypothetical protein
MDLDQAADQLYGGSPEEFIQRRKELVAEARRAGDRELVKQIGQLRRPTRSAWLVNLLARREPGGLQALLELGTALQDAQQRRSGNDLRRLSRERRAMIDALSRQAVEAGREQEYSPPDTAIQEVAQTLQAALGDPQVADLVRTGRLSQATTYGGFGPQDLSSMLAASLPDPAEEAPSTDAAEPATPLSSTGSKEDDAAQRRRAEADRVATEAEAAAAEARQAADDAETAAEEATTRADELADRIEAARRELRELESAERAARDDARAARRHHQELRQTAADAEQAATKARRQV